MPTIDLGPCECCGDDPVGSGSCPVFCDVVATVNGITVNYASPVVTVDEANDTKRTLGFATQLSGTTYVLGQPVRGTVSRISVLQRYSNDGDLDPEGPECVTERLFTGANAARIISEGNAGVVYSSTRARFRAARLAYQGFVFYNEIRREDFRPNWVAIWAWDWDSDGGVLTKEYAVGGRDSAGNPVETFPTLDLSVDPRMILACLPDGTCQQLQPGETTTYPRAWNCGCCGKSVTDEGCDQCENPLP